ncbi:MAG: peptide chain release factor 2 [Candidatus Sungbacteria bacterium]|uniref:Peptide chain release factor 2 n=1 Tax=Candidatus Sungiibacteriota bacterium TaxID=2750080 RepID=A0A9D6LR42_9BACT|nr:peptide chain release factor 2 [Candidatus Sungbacteria bacterium]
MYEIRSACSRNVFDLRQLREDILKYESELSASHIWQNDPERAKELGSQIANSKKEIARWEHITGEAATLEELWAIAGASPDSGFLREFDERLFMLEQSLRAVEIEYLFSGKYDKGSALVSIYSGAGGKDAEDWAAMLARMYERYAERLGWKVIRVHEHNGEYHGPSGWGIKNVTLDIKGDFAYGYLKHERGVHRLVRISPFSSQSLRHTSFALVEALPEMIEPEEIEIKPEEITFDFFRASGPGGQNVNKRETAVRVIHNPTGIQATAQSERTQERNRETAMQHLRAKLYQKKLAEIEAERRGIRGEQVSVEWGSQIRSYVLHPYRLVKDHRTNYETSDVEGVLDGDLDALVEASIRRVMP